MLTRFYADNFKCFSNFSIEFEALSVMVGPNGSGKSSVLDALRRVADLLTQRGTTEDLFPTDSLTRWDPRSEQLFKVDVRLPADELDGVSLPEGEYHYLLRLSHDRFREQNRIAEESLSFGDKILYRGRLEPVGGAEPRGASEFKAQLYRDDGTAGTQVLMDWGSSGIGRISPRAENQLLQRFRRYFKWLIILSINPASVRAEVKKDQERSMIDFDGGDFAAWYLFLSHNNATSCREAEQALQKSVLPSLALLQPETEGAIQVVKAIFRESGKKIALRLDELSAGQRAMVILEHAFAAAREWRGSLLIDEPANFLALEEIQPFLNKLQNASDEGETQVILTSHHPVAYDLLAEGAGLWLERSPLGPTQVARMSDLLERSSSSSSNTDETSTSSSSSSSSSDEASSSGSDAMPLSELVARGWVSPSRAAAHETAAAAR